ncbi:unnamed protein product, partial [Effrenium voratum]
HGASTETVGAVASAWARAGEAQKAAAWLREMGKMQLQPSSETLAAVLAGCSKSDPQTCLALGESNSGGRTVAFGALEAPSQHLHSALVAASARSGDLQQAEAKLQEMEQSKLQPNLITYTSLIDGCARRGDAAGAVRWLQELRQRGLSPNTVTYTSLIKCSAKFGDLPGAVRWLQEMTSNELTPDAMAYTAVIHCSAKKGNVDDATAWFKRMLENGLKADYVTYAALINACAKRSDVTGATAWLREILDQQLQPNVVAFSAALKTYGVIGRGGLQPWPGRRSDPEGSGLLPQPQLPTPHGQAVINRPVWQFSARGCWIGFGIDCERPGGSFEAGVAAQRLLHGSVYVVRELVGVKLENLFRLEPEAFDSLSIERCKAWCYSSIACQYWQFSETQGCFVDAPMLSKTLVPYPLTTAALASGTPESSNMIAGEYIHHYCPNRTASDVDDGFAAQVPANLAVPTHLDGPRVWPWVVLSLLLTLVLMIAAFAFYSVIWKRRDTARRPLARRAMDETVADARPNVQFTPVQVACARATDALQAQQLLKDMARHAVQPNVISYTSAIEVCAKSWPRQKEEAESLFRELLRKGVQPDTKLMRTMMRAVGMTHCMELCRELGVVDAAVDALAASFPGAGAEKA